jgi:hypothetical protein
VNYPCTTVSFTVSREPGGFVVLCQLALGISAFYDISVRRLAGLPPASSRHSLAGLPLLLASGCRRSAPMTFEHLDAGSSTGDFHPISSRPCWAYTIPLHADRIKLVGESERLLASGERHRYAAQFLVKAFCKIICRCLVLHILVG